MKLGKKLIAICLVLIATIALSISAPAAFAATNTKGSVTARALNVRTGPGKTFKKIGSLKKGTSVTILSTKGNWKKVEYKGRTGYAASKYIRVR